MPSINLSCPPAPWPVAPEPEVLNASVLHANFADALLPCDSQCHWGLEESEKPAFELPYPESAPSFDDGHSWTASGTVLPPAPRSGWWRCAEEEGEEEGAQGAEECDSVGRDPEPLPHEDEAAELDSEVPLPLPERLDPPAAAAGDDDFVDMLEELVIPYEYSPVQLSFACFGPLSADTQVFRLRNVCGQKIEVADSSGQTFLKGVGHFKPIGYYFDFYDPIGRFAFTVATLDLQEEEVYEFVGPHGTVIATAFRRRFRPRTTLRVCANTAKSETPVEVECRSMAGRSLAPGRYAVATPEGVPLGRIRRHHRKGLLTHQNFTIVVAPEVDPYLMVFLAVACNCVNNERSKLGWALGAAGLATILI